MAPIDPLHVPSPTSLTAQFIPLPNSSLALLQDLVDTVHVRLTDHIERLQEECEMLQRVDQLLSFQVAMRERVQVEVLQMNYLGRFVHLGAQIVAERIHALHVRQFENVISAGREIV